MAEAARKLLICGACSVQFEQTHPRQKYCQTCRDIGQSLYDRQSDAKKVDSKGGSLALAISKLTSVPAQAEVSEQTARQNAIRMANFLVTDPDVPPMIALDAMKALLRMPLSNKQDDQSVAALREEVKRAFLEVRGESARVGRDAPPVDDHRQAVEDGPPDTELGSVADP